jgi:hypothetical protein
MCVRSVSSDFVSLHRVTPLLRCTAFGHVFQWAFNRRLVGPWRRYGRRGEENRTTVFRLSVRSLATIPTELSRLIIFFHGATVPIAPGPLHCWGFTITLRHATLGRTPLDEWSTRRRELYLTTHKPQKRQTFMSLRDSNPQSQQARGRYAVPVDRTIKCCSKSCKEVRNIFMASTVFSVGFVICCASKHNGTIVPILLRCTKLF